EWRVRGDGDGGLFLALGEDLEEEFGPAAVELDVAELVEAEQLEAGVAADEPGQPSFVGGFGEFVDQLGGGDVADPPALFACGHPEPDQQMALAGAAVAEEHDGLAGVEIRAGRQGGDGGGVHGWRFVEVEVGEPFDPREPRFGDPADAATFVAFVDL